MPLLAYRQVSASAGVNALTQQIAMGNAGYDIRVNAILPGLMNTPHGNFEAWARATGVPRE